MDINYDKERLLLEYESIEDSIERLKFDQTKLNFKYELDLKDNIRAIKNLEFQLLDITSYVENLNAKHNIEEIS